jgi:hypothetical protein
LQTTFRKNSYFYRILERDEKVVLLEMFLRNKRIGFDVCKIKIAKGEIFGRQYPKREIIPSIDQFGIDGSKSFFPFDFDCAKKYFQD